MQTLPAILLGLLSCLVTSAGANRSIPEPEPSHPGNIFLVEQDVTVPVGQEGTPRWRVLDYLRKEVAAGTVESGRACIGKLPTGYYELLSESAQRTNMVSLGVLERLKVPTPLTSPIGIDVAMAWFYSGEKMDQSARLCALAGINWVRDRLSWPEVEPQPGQFRTGTRYDASAMAQSAAGLQVLQVMHAAPTWANPNTKRFPVDLRDVYRFEREMAKRWAGKVTAFEPWNEADIEVFGGHTGSEMASFQKAAWLGLKEGNPDVIACLNVLATHRGSTLEDLHQNESWAYFDTFNLHHYEPFSAYPKIYADFRAVSGGKPLWVTECSLPVKWQGDAQQQEPTPEDQRTQSERVAVTYALTIHEGARVVFFFLLPHYVEGQTQFGILRRDLTPRPAYVALAAAGRLLADARPLGRLKSAASTVHGYVFDARPDGRASKVLVLWADQKTEVDLPSEPLANFDHLGRKLETRRKLLAGAAPTYVLLPPAAQLDLAPAPAAAATLPGKASTIVLQAALPAEDLVLDQSAHKVATNGTAMLYVYNFGTAAAHGTLAIKAPSGWEAPSQVAAQVPAGGRQEIKLSLKPTTAGDAGSPGTVRINGNFGPAGEPVLSFRVMAARQAHRMGTRGQ